MPYLERPGAALFYDVVGDEPATVLTTHGLSESGAYWSGPGISAALAGAGFRAVDMDMRGHGRFVSDGSGDPAPSNRYSDPDYEGPFPAPLERPIDNPAVKGAEKINIHERLKYARDKGRDRPFLSGFKTNEGPDRCWRWAEDILGAGNPTSVVEFARTFYTDADPRIAQLKKISCSNLALLGELDEKFIKPAELLARQLPRVAHEVVAGRGHMLAIEDPEGTAKTLIDFLRSVR